MTQKEIIKEILRTTPKWFPAHYFVGEKLVNGRWVFMSYKTPARLSDLFKEGLVARRKVTGKTGAKFYEYKWAEYAGA